VIPLLHRVPARSCAKTAASLPRLKALAIKARIHGLAVETTLRQTFVNAFSEPLEAVYIFPLPQSAAPRASR
jgi:Ca-activated chloride channel homolog